MAKENTLIYRAQTGDEGAFADLMWEYYAYVYAIVVGIVDNAHDAEEVVQDAFFNAYQGLTQLEDTTKFRSWLAEITRNCARQRLRKQGVDTVSIDEVSEQMLQTQDAPDERLTQLEQRELIRRTIETLPQKDREIVRFAKTEGPFSSSPKNVPSAMQKIIEAESDSYQKGFLAGYRDRKVRNKRLYGTVFWGSFTIIMTGAIVADILLSEE